jgi:hypothetical protein
MTIGPKGRSAFFDVLPQIFLVLYTNVKESLLHQAHVSGDIVLVIMIMAVSFAYWQIFTRNNGAQPFKLLATLRMENT